MLWNIKRHLSYKDKTLKRIYANTLCNIVNPKPLKIVYMDFEQNQLYCIQKLYVNMI